MGNHMLTTGCRQHLSVTKPQVSLRARVLGRLSFMLLMALACITILSACGPTPTSAGPVQPVCYGGSESVAPQAKSADTPQILIAATATSAEPRPAVGSTVIQELAAFGRRDDACVHLLAGGGAHMVVTSLPITPFRHNGQPERGSRRSAALRANLTTIERAVADLANRDDGLDTLGLLTEAVRRYPGPGTIYMVSSGLSTVGVLDFRHLGFGADPAQIADFLKRNGWLPDLSGRQVVWIGLGDAAGSQPDLTPPLRQVVIADWLALCREAEALECRVVGEKVGITAPTARTTVPPVTLPAPITTPQQVILPSSMMFSLNSSELSGTADAALRSVATQLGSRHVVVVGHTDASTGTTTGNLSLSLDRARAVADRLIALGVSRGQIDQVVGLGSQGFSAQDEARDPALVSAHRTVVLTFQPATTS